MSVYAVNKYSNPNLNPAACQEVYIYKLIK